MLANELNLQTIRVTRVSTFSIQQFLLTSRYELVSRKKHSSHVPIHEFTENFEIWYEALKLKCDKCEVAVGSRIGAGNRYVEIYTCILPTWLRLHGCSRSGTQVVKGRASHYHYLRTV